MQFARGCEFTTKNKKLKTWGGKLCAIKKIVRDPSVFVGPLPSALPPPLKPNPIRVYPVGHCGSWFAWPCCTRSFCCMVCVALCFVGHCGSWFLHNTQQHTHILRCQFDVSLWVVWVVVKALFKRCPNGVLTPTLHTYNFFEL